MIDFSRHVLPNGLTVLISPDDTTQLVAVNLLYRVGARDEEEHRTGFAHLFEHLMFGGSMHAPQYDEVAQQVGAENNAFTSNDLTNYYLSLPSANLETALWLEADRMANLDISERSLEVQRAVVVEEFKQRYLNQPYGDAWLRLRPMVYKTHPYRWATIGKEIRHIEEASLEEVAAFFKAHYTPTNCILAVSGDLQEGPALELITKYFGDMPVGTRNPALYPQETEQTEARHEEVEADVPAAAFYWAYAMPGRADATYPATDMLTDVLSQGASSRLYLRFVKEERLLSSVNAYVTGDYDGGMLVFQGRLHPGVEMATVEAALNEEINRLQTELVPEHEMQKMKNRYEAEQIAGEISVLNRAMALCFAEMQGDAEGVNNEIERYLRVTPEDMRTQALAVLKPERRNSLFYKPTKASTNAAELPADLESEAA